MYNIRKGRGSLLVFSSKKLLCGLNKLDSSPVAFHWFLFNARWPREPPSCVVLKCFRVEVGTLQPWVELRNQCREYSWNMFLVSYQKPVVNLFCTSGDHAADRSNCAFVLQSFCTWLRPSALAEASAKVDLELGMGGMLRWANTPIAYWWTF